MVMVVVAVVAAAQGQEETTGFVTWGNNYYQTWGHQALVINKTSELQLTLDKNSGFLSLFLSVYMCLCVCV